MRRSRFSGVFRNSINKAIQGTRQYDVASCESENLRVLNGPLHTGKLSAKRRCNKERRAHGLRALTRIPSRAWTMAISRVMARTAPFEAVYAI